MAQAVSRSPFTAGILSSRLGHSMWVSCYTNLSLDRFFSGFLQFSPATNSISPFLHTHLINLISFHFIRLCDGASGLVSRHPCYSQTLKYRGFIAWYPSTRTYVGRELRNIILQIEYTERGSHRLKMKNTNRKYVIISVLITNSLLGHPEVHCHPYISPPLDPIFS